MSEDISRLMDGEVGGVEDHAAWHALRQRQGMLTWTCYHAIGDVLRGEVGATRDLSADVAKRLAAEPTVLAPHAPAPPRPAAWAWAVAATLAAVAVVGWTAWSLVDATPAGLARVAAAGSMRSSEIGPTTVSTDYLLAHQEYAPSAILQGVGPYLRDVAVTREVRP
ncbi:MAG: hypothetical protein JSS46_02105 [Proteobacteria bacterium]|nr:hypothetical protein [Pseudomonadota bacterium]